MLTKALARVKLDGFNLNSYTKAKTDLRFVFGVCPAVRSLVNRKRAVPSKSRFSPVQRSSGDFLLSVSLEAASDQDGRREGRNECTA